jgi:hypothetical protein
MRMLRLLIILNVKYFDTGQKTPYPNWCNQSDSLSNYRAFWQMRESNTCLTVQWFHHAKHLSLWCYARLLYEGLPVCVPLELSL